MPPNTAMQPTCSVGAILPFSGAASAVASVRPVLSCRTRLMASRWAACGLWRVFVWVQFAILRVYSARRAVIQGKRSRRLLLNRRTVISSARSRVVRRSFVAFHPARPNTAMQPTCSVGAISPAGGMGTLSRSIVFVPSSRTRLMANRSAAILP